MVKGVITMRALHSLLRAIAEIIGLGASSDLSRTSFAIDADDIDRDLSFGRS
jgi:hypothetical protein